MRILGLAAMFATALCVSGCASTPLSAPGDATKIDITITNIPADIAVRAPKVTLNQRPDIDEIIAWLMSIDWSQAGEDMTAIRLPQPDGNIVLTTKAGATQDYSFFWDGKFVDTRANRLLRGADMGKWKKIVERVCK